MASEFFRELAIVALVSSVAMILVRLLRQPLRRAAGARAAYWLWLLVPAMSVAAWLPVPSGLLLPPTMALPAQVQSLMSLAVEDNVSRGGAGWAVLLLWIWAAGVVLMLVALIGRQRAFTRSLGTLHRDSRGWWVSECIRTPMLAGLGRSRILVPADFDSRFSAREQELVLAHERAHARRGDVGVNLLASLALCAFWFNPLAYRAVGWLREDQELACDAAVLASRPDARRLYADALLKVQLAAQAAWRAPIACSWEFRGTSGHPLKERILMIKQPTPPLARRLAGIGIALVLTTAMACGVWAGQAPVDGKGTPILVDLKMTITNSRSNDTRALATRYLVKSGETIRDEAGAPLEFYCTPYLPDDLERADWPGDQAGAPLPTAHQILLRCSIRQAGGTVRSFALIIDDDNWGVVETTDEDASNNYRMEMKATTSAERLADARNMTNH